MATKYSVGDVFTPSSRAKLTFIERDTINEKLVNAIRTKGKQLVVYGHSGSGKTTLLLNKLDQLYEDYIPTRCMGGLTVDQLILDAFDQLAPFFVAEKSSGSKQTAALKLGGEYLGIQSKIGLETEKTNDSKQQRVLPPQLTPQALARFLGEAKCCWVLEDFHKIDEGQKVVVSQMMKVFMDMADSYPDVKIIALGAVDTAREVVKYDSEMRNRVAEIHVPLMDAEEILGIIKKGEALLNISFDEKIRSWIVHYSNGLASVCHHLCLNTARVSGVSQTCDTTLQFTEENMKAGLALYFEEASDTLKHAFDRAFKRKKSGKFDNCRIILQALSNCAQDGASHAEIIDSIKITHYPSSNLTLYLRELQKEERGAIIRHDANSGKFSFSDPIYRAFCLAYFEKHPVKTQLNESTFDYFASLNFTDILSQLTINPDEMGFLTPQQPKKTMMEEMMEEAAKIYSPSPITSGKKLKK